MKEREMKLSLKKKGQDEEKMRWNETSADLSEFSAAAEYKESNEKLSTGKIQDCLIELDHYSKHK